MSASRTVILEGIVGSHAYGLNTPDSDVDRFGVFVFPTEHVLGLGFNPKQETVAVGGSEDKQVQPDQASHEIAKFLRLALAMNPTVTEALWLDQYTVRSIEGDMLLACREAFLSQRARNTYLGYAYAQIERFRKRDHESFSADTRKRSAKHARHIMRLVHQGHLVLTTGKVHVRLDPDVAAGIRSRGEWAVSQPTRFVDQALALIEEVRNEPSVLPVEPDVDLANDLLLTIRRRHYT